MKQSFSRKASWAVAGVAAVTLALPAFSASAAQTRAPHWLVWNAKSHTATLTLIGGYNNNIGGFNFNGYGNGKMTITVPNGAHVNVVFSNNSALPHSVLFTPFSKRNSTGGYPLAFKGASSPNATNGTAKGKTQKFSFVANKVGQYAIVCSVPGHESAGMWDTFVVAKSGNAAMTFKK